MVRKTKNILKTLIVVAVKINYKISNTLLYSFLYSVLMARVIIVRLVQSTRQIKKLRLFLFNSPSYNCDTSISEESQLRCFRNMSRRFSSLSRSLRHPIHRRYVAGQPSGIRAVPRLTSNETNHCSSIDTCLR